MDPINQYSPGMIRDIKALSPHKLLKIILLWHAENTKLSLWDNLRDNYQTVEAFQKEWDVLCGALSLKLSEEDSKKITITTIKREGGKSIVTYSFTEISLR